MLDFGIELEMTFPTNVSAIDVANRITAAGVYCFYAGYGHATTRGKWKVVTDISIVGGLGRHGLEIVSPPLGEEGLDQIRKVCEAVKGIGATVNRSCGFHVHIGARNLTIDALKKLAAIYVTYEDVIDGLMPPSRRGNGHQYIRSNKAQIDIGRLAAATTTTEVTTAVAYNLPSHLRRYIKLNYEAFWRHGTVEFRHHSGTIDPDKIISWIWFCSKMVAAAKQPGAEPLLMANGPTTPHFRRSRDRRIYAALAAAGGSTSEELRIGMGARSRLNFPAWLRNHGLAARVVGRRGGRKAWQIMTSNGAVVSMPVATFEALCSKLALTEEERAFWQTRIVLLQGGGTEDNGPAARVSNTMLRAMARSGV